VSTTESPAQLLEARALAAEIASRGDEIESGRRLPPDLAKKFASSGFFSICVPARTAAASSAATSCA
jgi:hypothetical protein